MRSDFEAELIDGMAADSYEFGDRHLCVFWASSDSELHVARLLEHFPENAVIADLGCGFGELSFVAKSTHPDLTVVSVNCLPVQLSYAPEPKALADFEALPFDNNYFDGAIFSWSFGHANYEDAVAELKRVLKPGGLVVIWDLKGPEDGLERLAYTPFSAYAARFASDGFWLVERYEPEGALYVNPIVPEIVKAEFVQYSPLLHVYKFTGG